MSSFFAGLDWASQTHAVCVIDERGSVRRATSRSRHDAAGLAELLRRLRARHAQPHRHRAALGPAGRCLVEAGFTVVPIHPNAVKASRPRYRSHGGKSDA